MVLWGLAALSVATCDDPAVLGGPGGKGGGSAGSPAGGTAGLAAPGAGGAAGKGGGGPPASGGGQTGVGGAAVGSGGVAGSLGSAGTFGGNDGGGRGGHGGGSAGKPGTGGASGGAKAIGGGGGRGTGEGGAGGTSGNAGGGGHPGGGAMGGGPAVGGGPAMGGGPAVGGGPAMGGASATGGASGAGGATPAATIRVTDFANYQVVQRAIGGTNQAVSVSGTYSGNTVKAVQAQVVDFATGNNVVVAWTTIAATVSGGTFAGSLTVPQGGWYKIAVRAVDANSVELNRDLGTRRWGVGFNILVIGQSNMVGNGGVSSYTPVPGDLEALYSNDNVWKRLSDPYDDGGLPSEVDYDSWVGASMIPALANALAAQFPTVPIGIVPAARGSSPLHGTSSLSWVSRNPANHADATNLYGNSVANARAAGGVELIVMHQGETDATNMTSQATYRADLQSLLGFYREDLYATIPLFICQLGRSTSAIGDKNRTDVTMQPIRSAQLLSDDGANIYLAATTIDLDVDGTDHYLKAAHDTIGLRVANTIKHRYGAASYYRGPAILSAAYVDAGKSSIDVRLQHRGGTDFTPTTGINGFQVLDGGVAVTLGAVSRKDASTINITLPAPITGIATVRYLYGKLPTSSLAGAVHDNTALQLPLEPTALDVVVP